MHQQIAVNRNECLDLLTHSFEPSSASTRQALFKFFDVDSFKRDLNTKFQVLLNDQLSSLERRLIRKRINIQKQLGGLEAQLVEQNPQSTREYIKLFLRELLTIITELVTGNYMIIRLPDSGDCFLNSFGGNLSENLEEGHQLSMELFPQKELYDPDFLNKIRVSFISDVPNAFCPKRLMRTRCSNAQFRREKSLVWRHFRSIRMLSNASIRSRNPTSVYVPFNKINDIFLI